MKRLDSVIQIIGQPTLETHDTTGHQNVSDGTSWEQEVLQRRNPMIPLNLHLQSIPPLQCLSRLQTLRDDRQENTENPLVNANYKS